MRTHRLQPDQKPALIGQPGSIEAPAVGVSITNERGERYRYQARAVSLRMKRGVLQVIERERGCFVWFERCNLEVHDGRRTLLFRLLAGSASSDGTDLTIVAEVASLSPPRRQGRAFANGRPCIQRPTEKQSDSTRTAGEGSRLKDFP